MNPKPSIYDMSIFKFFVFVILVSPFAFAAKPDPKSLLEKSDRARGGVTKGMSWDIAIESKQAGNTYSAVYGVQVKDVNVLARCKSPPRQKDEVYLFNDRNLWVFRPGLRKPISVSPRQRLTGQAAIGDIANTNYARDYDGKIVGEEVVNGVSTYKLELKSKASNTTYDAITYWISKDKSLGVKAEFLTTEGKVFKRAEIEYKNSVGSIPFVSKMTIRDAAFPDNQSVLSYAKPQPEKISDTIFNVNNLAR